MSDPTALKWTLIMLIGVNVLFTYRGFKDPLFFDKYLFRVDPILIGKEWVRLLTSSFLHVGWWHLTFNMVALYSFGLGIGWNFSVAQFLVIYFGSMLFADLLALYVHRNHGDYSAVGASGAVCGVIFCYVVLYPFNKISIFFIPGIPAWLFGIGYILISIYGIKRKVGNIGHEAHLGGAIGGTLISLFMLPGILIYNWWIVLAILIPCSIFLYLIVTRPWWLLIDGYYSGKMKAVVSPRKKNPNQAKAINKDQELDTLLDKISRKGLGSLSDKERKRLDDLSK